MAARRCLVNRFAHSHTRRLRDSRLHVVLARRSCFLGSPEARQMFPRKNLRNVRLARLRRLVGTMGSILRWRQLAAVAAVPAATTSSAETAAAAPAPAEIAAMPVSMMPAVVKARTIL